MPPTATATATATVALVARQLWDNPAATRATGVAHCTPFTLPSRGVVSWGSSVITLTTDAIFQPECTGTGSQGVSTVEKLRDPFYASTIPQTYVIAAVTVIAWILVLMLMITPRSSFLGTSGINPAISNGHGIIGGATGGSTGLIGVGSRPWLQKVAALTVAVSLTIATADTFRCAQEQYEAGYMDATALRDDVLGSKEIRVVRVISDVFLWLAQVQTLIRLFPRHKEKVLIKWIGFVLIVFDVIFTCLNSFLIRYIDRPRNYTDAISALSYLFELALGLLYAAWVIFYSLTKRRYAYYHPKMRDIILIAVLSLIAILTPVVFFITDVSNQDIAGWGDYFRWVGAAAASVVVWEWVERIEALEREDRRDGILGREIFDGDDMLDVSPSEEAVWSQSRRESRRDKKDERGGGGGGGVHQTSALEAGLTGVAQRLRRTQHAQPPPQHFPLGRAHSTTTNGAANNTELARDGRISFGNLPKPSDMVESGHGGNNNEHGPTPPPTAVSPVSRTDTASAASTVYVVRYDTEVNAPQPVRRRLDRDANGNANHRQGHGQHTSSTAVRDPEKEAAEEAAEIEMPESRERISSHARWQSVSNPFKRKRASPPTEVQQVRKAQQDEKPAKPPTPPSTARWNLRRGFGAFAQPGGLACNTGSSSKRESLDLPVTVIPAPQRGSGRTWSPQDARTNRDPVDGTVTPRSSGDSSQRGSVSASTTLTDNSEPSPTSASGQNPMPTARPASANEVASSNPNRASPTYARAPRADELRPSGSGNDVFVVAPPVRRSPLRNATTPEPSGSDGDGAGGI